MTKKRGPSDDAEHSSKHSKRRQTSESFSFRNPAVQVMVGKQTGNSTPRTFTVLQNLLTSDSKFFERMLQSDFSESKEGIVKLPECEPEIFDLYVMFLYHGDIFSAPAVKTKQVPNEDGFKEKCTLIDAIGLADFLQSDAFHNSCINAFLDCCNEYNSSFRGHQADLRIFKAGVPSLIKLVEDFYVYSSGVNWFTEEFNKGTLKSLSEHPEFYHDILVQSLRLLDSGGRMGQLPWEQNRCHYHRHVGVPV
ncbi:hypothetical protein BT63DRAFT_415502 [Microthyrium microscopicum]|uniref:BTB domain-containing protein n=1 Tax=Microthyrium microscopicum TaxID=703497 RepID=A0A6A6U9L0_9PEZI|nr:hypothetical protein BT63DRAFT_415502 [Microthyrium microscopicum]